MGVDYRAVNEFGVCLTTQECEAALEKLGVEYTHDEPEEELAAQYGLRVARIGDAWSGDVWYIIGPEHKEVVSGPNRSIKVDEEGLKGLDKLIKDAGFDCKPEWHKDTYVY